MKIEIEPFIENIPDITHQLIINVSRAAGCPGYAQKKEILKLEVNYLVQNKPWTIEIPLWIPGYAGEFACRDISVEGDEDWEPVNPIEPPPGWDLGKIFKRVFSDNWYLKFFFLTRIHLQKIYADNSDPTRVLDIDPAWAEPLFGLQNQLTWKRWLVILNGDYGDIS